MQGTNIILIGMPASGKSTAGVLLAKTLGKDFVDTDLVLQKRIGMKLQEHLDRYGLQSFLKEENDALAEFKSVNTVIATGGSAVYHQSGMENLKTLGSLVFIDVPWLVLQERLKDIGDRGVALAPGQTLEDLYNQRMPLYQKWADKTITVKPQETLEQTVERLRLSL